MTKQFHCVTVGNPNAGKSTLFNALTGASQQVGNWSGVTVEKKTGKINYSGTDIFLTDLPGIYDLLPAGNSCDCSLDEQIAQAYLSNQQVDAIINLVDATNVERHLYLTTQLRELGIPIIVVINKIDAAKKLGININVDDMSVRLGCPVVAICSRNQADVEQLQAELMSLLEKGDSVQSLMLQYHTDIEASVTALQMQNDSQGLTELSRGQALAILANSHGDGCGTSEVQLHDTVKQCTLRVEQAGEYYDRHNPIRFCATGV